MNIRTMAVGLGILWALSETASDTAVASQGSIHLQGAIVGTPCRTRLLGHELALQGCPGVAGVTSVLPVATVRSLEPAGAPVRLKVVEGQRAFDRQYVLLDAANRRIRSGNYRVTLAYP